MNTKINIIGAGFAGVEASFFLANKGFKINLYEMRSKKTTPAHKTNLFAELVCSNSFKSTALDNAHGLLKKEMEIFDSLIIKTAYENFVPAGGALAVDREKFSSSITKKIKDHPNITTFNEEIVSVDKWLDNNEVVIIATGPLTSSRLEKSIIKIIGQKSLYFFDAASPIIDGKTIDYNKVFFQSRYDKGEADYLNAPFNKEKYIHFVEEIIKSEKIKLHDFENKKIFEGCVPIEVLAQRGIDTLAFGPMKPVGLIDPNTNKRPYAVVQMRMENINKSMFNLVGFQTRLKWNEQKRIFQLIPGLENAEILRYGVMHKNTFINFPQLVNSITYSLKSNPNLYFAGQITGIEGYIESAASGIYTGYALWALLNNKPLLFPDDTMIGALQKYTLLDNKNYQPMASNFGLLNKDVFNEKGKRLKGRDKKKKISEQALERMEEFIVRV